MRAILDICFYVIYASSNPLASQKHDKYLINLTYDIIRLYLVLRRCALLIQVMMPSQHLFKIMSSKNRQKENKLICIRVGGRFLKLGGQALLKYMVVPAISKRLTNYILSQIMDAHPPFSLPMALLHYIKIRKGKIVCSMHTTQFCIQRRYIYVSAAEKR